MQNESPTRSGADEPVRVGVIGASGFAGSEVLRLAVGHPGVRIVWATGDSQAGSGIAALYPSLAAAYGSATFVEYSPSLLDGVDAVFLALPHGASQLMMRSLTGSVRWIIDLAADFRLKDPALYPIWYDAAHEAPELLTRFAYGLPELYRAEIATSQCVAAPGCYPTAAILGLAPLVGAGVIETRGVIVDAASGVSGAGRPAKSNTSFCTVDEDFTAYGLSTHRHTPEMEIHTGATVLFTPHLAPMNRGILATCYGRAARRGLSTDAVLDVLHSAYDDEPFVVVSDRIPSTKATAGSNCAHLSARYDERTDTVIVLAAIDNLVKGTAGQAIQCLNLMAGFDETAGLPVVGLTP